MTVLSTLRRYASLLSRTPLHPQWLVLREDSSRLDRVAARARGRVLDIGCSTQRLRDRLSSDCDYVGLDYPPTGEVLYKIRPDVHGDVRALPFRSGSFDTVTLLEVLEHVDGTSAALDECARVMSDDGILLFSMPFLYPLHDAPYDFQRFTRHGLDAAFERAGLTCTSFEPHGTPLSTACLLTNIAIAHTILRGRTPLPLRAVLLLVAPVLVPLINLVGRSVDLLTAADDFMPNGYSCSLQRTVRNPAPDDV